MAQKSDSVECAWAPWTFIQLPGQAGEKVLVVMNLESSTRKLIRKNSVVAIETEGLLGSKYVTIMTGSEEAPTVE